MWFDCIPQADCEELSFQLGEVLGSALVNRKDLKSNILKARTKVKDFVRKLKGGGKKKALSHLNDSDTVKPGTEPNLDPTDVGPGGTVNRQFRDANGRLRNADWTFAYDGGPKPRTSVGTHGNTAGDQPATLYERYDADGNFLKHGISQDPSKRYTQAELDGGYLIRIQTGPRSEILKIERNLVETNPGPLNKEPWAGSRSGK